MKMTVRFQGEESRWHQLIETANYDQVLESGDAELIIADIIASIMGRSFNVAASSFCTGGAMHLLDRRIVVILKRRIERDISRRLRRIICKVNLSRVFVTYRRPILILEDLSNGETDRSTAR